jgi:hypothetical protein
LHLSKSTVIIFLVFSYPLTVSFQILEVIRWYFKIHL